MDAFQKQKWGEEKMDAFQKQKWGESAAFRIFVLQNGGLTIPSPIFVL